MTSPLRKLDKWTLNEAGKPIGVQRAHYLRHQGTKEKARRLKQLEAAHQRLQARLANGD